MRPLSLLARVFNAIRKLGFESLQPGLRKGARKMTKFGPRILSSCSKSEQTLPIKNSYEKHKEVIPTGIQSLSQAVYCNCRGLDFEEAWLDIPIYIDKSPLGARSSRV